MTTHKLTFHGSRRTRCRLTVPDIIEVRATAGTWEDGDGDTGPCTGCYPENVAPPPSSPRPAALQRFKAMKGTVQIGDAIVNRDGSVNVYLQVVPADGKLTLVIA